MRRRGRRRTVVLCRRSFSLVPTAGTSMYFLFKIRAFSNLQADRQMFELVIYRLFQMNRGTCVRFTGIDRPVL